VALRVVSGASTAERGTIFLDEVASCLPTRQSSCCACCRSASSNPSAATRRCASKCACSPPRTAISKKPSAKNRFRADLFYRLNVIPLRVPPLRERRSDIAPLAMYFMERSARKSAGRCRHRSSAAPPPPTMTGPGNVRELQNVIERAVVLSPGQSWRSIRCCSSGRRLSLRRRRRRRRRCKHLEM